MSIPEKPTVERWLPKELSDMLRKSALEMMDSPEGMAHAKAVCFDLACSAANHGGTETAQ